MEDLNNYLQQNLNGHLILQVERSGCNAFMSFIYIDNCKYFYCKITKKHKLIIQVHRCMLRNTRYAKSAKYVPITNFTNIFMKSVPININGIDIYVSIQRVSRRPLEVQESNDPLIAKQTIQMKQNLKHLVETFYNNHNFFYNTDSFIVLVKGTKQVAYNIRKIIDNKNIKVKAIKDKNYCSCKHFQKFFNIQSDDYIKNKDHIMLNTQRLLINYITGVLENVRFTK